MAHFSPQNSSSSWYTGGPHRGGTPRRPLTTNEVLNGSVEEVVSRRLRKTPRVFQSGGDKLITNIQRRELRAAMLPSIMRDCASQENRASTAGPLTTTGTPRPGGMPSSAEVLGDFHKVYKETLVKRAQEEANMVNFLPRDANCIQPDCDPEQIIASACTVLTDFAQQRLERFRRPAESFVDFSSDFPFFHLGRDQVSDLEELAKVLTLDLERRERVVKGTVKRPGFLSLQVASRVPLAVRDPTTMTEVKPAESEYLPDSDLHVMRLDLFPSEVRQVAFALDGPGFRSSQLCQRMRAIVDPEAGTLASITKTLSDKASEVDGVVCVLNDILRDVQYELPAMSNPTLEIASLEDGPAERLRRIMEEPRRILKRLVETIDTISVIVSPVLPRIASAMDKLSLICIRQLDRLAARFHSEYERLLRTWTKTESERQRFMKLFCIDAGSLDANGGVNIGRKMGRTEVELVQQEQTHATLLKEVAEIKQQLEESRRSCEFLQRRNADLLLHIQCLQKDRGSAPATQIESSEKFPSNKQSGSPTNSVLVQNKRSGAAGNHSKTRGSIRGFVPFNIHADTQTETEPYFSDSPEMPDEYSFEGYGSLLSVAYRLYKTLRKYDWNSVASAYLITSETDSNFDNPPEAMLLAAQPTPKDNKAAQLNLKMRKLHEIKTKVERAHQNASISQLEEEVARLQEFAKIDIEGWIMDRLMGVSPEKAAALEEIDPISVWTLLRESLHTEGMRKRIYQLEEQLGSLLLIAEMYHPAPEGGKSASDNDLWSRVMESARRRSMTRRGSTDVKALASQHAGSDSSLVHFPALEHADVMANIAAIWDLGLRSDLQDSAHPLNNRQPHKVVQSLVASFFLQKFSKTNHVEAAMVSLCRGVIDFCHDTRIALFSVMCDVQSPAMLGDRLHKPRRQVRREGKFEFEASRLASLPVDAVQVMTSLISDLHQATKIFTRETALDRCAAAHDGEVQQLPSRVSRRRVSGIDGGKEAVDEMQMPLQIVLAVARPIITARCAAVAQYFELALFAYADFDCEVGATRRMSANHLAGISSQTQAERTTATNSEEVEGQSGRTDRRVSQPKASIAAAQLDHGFGNSDELVKQETLFVSHVFQCYIDRSVEEMCKSDEEFDEDCGGSASTSANEQGSREEVLDRLWMKMINHARLSHFRHMPTSVFGQQTMPASKAARLLVELGVLNLPQQFVSRVLANCTGGGKQQPSDAEISRMTLEILATTWQTARGNASATCRECSVHWAALWALAHERMHEMDLIGDLFRCFDDSGDGWMQFEEFLHFFQAVCPSAKKSDAEHFFMWGADDSGDMKFEAFQKLVPHLNLRTDVDYLEKVVANRRAELYGENEAKPAHSPSTIPPLERDA